MPVTDSSSEQADELANNALPRPNWRAQRKLALGANFGLRADPQLGRVTEIMRAEAALAARRLSRARRSIRDEQQSA